MWGLLTLIPGLVNGLLSYLAKKQDVVVAAVGANRDTAIAMINANVAAYHEQTGLAALRWGWWGTRYLLLAAAIPPVLHSGAVYLDSTFLHSWIGDWLGMPWSIPRAPGVYEGQELQIIAVVVGYQIGQPLVGGLVSWLIKR